MLNGSRGLLLNARSFAIAGRLGIGVRALAVTATKGWRRRANAIIRTVPRRRPGQVLVVASMVARDEGRRADDGRSDRGGIGRTAILLTMPDPVLVLTVLIMP